MRIEILVDNEEPRIYPLNRPKIVVGSHEACDIVIGHKGISRKHCIITQKDDKFFVADQGSTNGSYINEHRLVPGNAAEFSSFFPVRLGDNVLMTLLSDEEAQDLGADSDFNTQIDSGPVRDESTKMISLKDLHKSSTAGLVQKRTETVTKRKIIKKAVIPEKKQAASNTFMAVIAFFLIGSAVYYQFFLREKEVEVVKANVAKAPPEIVDNRPIKRIEDNHLPSAESLLAVVKNPKCSTDFEKDICNTMPLIYQEKWGTVLLDKNLIIVADGFKYPILANSFLAKPKPLDQGGTIAENRAHQIDIGMLSLMLWMKENIPLEVNKIDSLKDFIVTVAFVDFSNLEGPTLVSTAVFDPEAFLRLRKKINDKHFTDAKKNGAAEFSYALEYLRFL